MEDDAASLPVGGDGLEEGQQVGGSDDGHRCGVDVRREGHTRKRGVAAVGAAHDANPLGIHDALGHQVLHTPGEVILHAVAPLLVAGIEELLAVARGAPEVGRQYRIAAVGQELGVGVEAPLVPGPGAAVGEDHQGQVLGGDALGQAEVGGNFQAITGLVADGLHGHQGLPGQILTRDIFQGELLGAPIEEVAGAGIAVAGGRDHADLLVIGGGGEADLLARQLLLEQLIVRFPGLVLPVDPGAVIQVGGGDELVCDLGEDGRTEVHSTLGVGLDLGLLPSGGVEEHQLHQVPSALVGLEIDPLAVLVEGRRACGLEDAALVDLGEALGIHPEDLRVPLFRGAKGQAQAGLLIEDPTGNALGVLAEQGPLARGDLDLVDVVPGCIPVVEAHIDGIWIRLGDGIDHGPGPLGGGQVAGLGGLLAGGRGGGRIHGIDVEVLVPVLVLDKEDLLAVPAPEEPGDGPLGIGGNETTLGVGFTDLLDPDVAGLLPGLQEGNPFPIRR